MLTFILATIINGVELYKPDLAQTCEQLCERIEKLYTPEYLNGKESDLREDPESRCLLHDIRCTKDDDAKINSLLISKIGLIKLPTDPKTSVTSDWIKSRASWVRGLRFFGSPYKGDEEDFWRICRYLPTIKKIDYPTRLARMRGGPIPKSRQAEYELQKKVYELNMSIGDFRSALEFHCRAYIWRVSSRMTDEELNDFSNRVDAVIKPAKGYEGRFFREIYAVRQHDREHPIRYKTENGVISVIDQGGM